MNLRRRLLGISPAEVTFARRGFHTGNRTAVRRLERAAQVFLSGYHAALSERGMALCRRLDGTDDDVRGFAYEGASMAVALSAMLRPRGAALWRAFADTCATSQVYTAHVGVGWALARIPRRIETILAWCDPLLRWLVIDGYGFHAGFFHAGLLHADLPYPWRIAGYGRCAFDQGLGRSLWFVDGADVRRIAERIRIFGVHRRADLWSGVGLAAAYAGGVDREDLLWLREAAGVYRPALAQGVAFAAKARQRAGETVDHTELAAHVMCGVAGPQAARMVDDALCELSGGAHDVLLYEAWRQRIQARFTSPVLS